jgi:hypothetical protein
MAFAGVRELDLLVGGTHTCPLFLHDQVIPQFIALFLAETVT